MIAKTLAIFTDGGARGNPGPAACAFVVKNDQEIIFKATKPLGKTTNNVAEYQAVLEALSWLVKQQAADSNPPTVVNFYSDSQLIVNQLKGLFKIKDRKLKILIIKIRELEKKFGQKIIYHLIPRQENKMADALVNQSLDFFMSARLL